MITGADLKYLDLDQDPPGSQKDRSEVEFEVLDRDRYVPYPAQETVAGWWKANRDRFEPGRRYLFGLPIEPNSLCKVLLQGKQQQCRRRPWKWPCSNPGNPYSTSALAVEFRRRELRRGRGRAQARPITTPLSETRERGDRQKAKLQAWIS